MTTSRYDAILIGAGHNGLVCATYLAKAGLKVLVLERRGVVGGAAVTEEFHPGFRNSVAAYTVSLLQPKVIRDLDLEAHGLRIVQRKLNNFLPLPDGRYLATGAGRTHAEIAKFSPRDAERLPEYERRLDAIADVLRALALEPPPNVTDGGWIKALPEMLRAVQADLFVIGSQSLHLVSSRLPIRDRKGIPRGYPLSASFISEY